jgi:prolipoprotein diacylglyceryltransferase
MLAILSAAFFFHKGLKRFADMGIFKATKVKVLEGLPAQPGELVSNAIFGFILGFKGWHLVQNFAEFKRDAAGVLLSTEGNWPIGILMAALFAGLFWWDKKRKAYPKPKEVIQNIYPHDRIADLTMVAAIMGIIGAKLFAILEEPSGFMNDPLGTLFSGSGLTIYGGLILGFLGVLWYLRKHNIPVFHTLDALAIAYVIAYGVGRIGCQLAGDGDWGIVAAAQPDWWFLPDWMWSYDYPNNVNNANYFGGRDYSLGGFVEGCDPEVFNAARGEIEDRCQEACGIRYCHLLTEKVYPTPFYETIASFVIAGILYGLRSRLKIPGMLFFVYLIFNGLQRFFIEKIRVNVEYEFLPFSPTQAEIISLLLVIVGIGGIIWLRQKGKGAT